MNKQIISIAVIVLLVVVTVGGILIYKSKANKSATVIPTPIPVNEIINIPIEEKPFLELIPRDDGKSITMTLARFGLAKKVEYELAYNSQGIPRGVIGDTVLSGTEFSKELLLGTCSRNVCRYDEGVSKGEITLKFREDAGVKKFITNFFIQQTDKELKSSDEVFSLTGKLTKAYYIVTQTVGLPAKIDGSVVAGPFGVFSSISAKLRTGKIVFSGQSDPNLKIYSWENNDWIEKSIKVENGNITATVEDIGVFVLVDPQ